MSTVIMSACWPLQMPPTRKAVLISLADNANDQGHCWPSIPTICERTCFSERAVHRAIKELEADGLLVADRSNGRHTRYIINTATPANAAEPPQQVRGRNSDTPADAAAEPPQMRQEPPQMRQEPPQQVRSNRKEPSRTVRSNRHSRALSDAVEFLPEVPTDLLADFIEVREKKKLAMTKTAMDGIRREAAKAGISIESAIRLCCERGWGGLQASWMAAGNVHASASATSPENRPGGGRKLL